MFYILVKSSDGQCSHGSHVNVYKDKLQITGYTKVETGKLLKVMWIIINFYFENLVRIYSD